MNVRHRLMRVAIVIAATSLGSCDGSRSVRPGLRVTPADSATLLREIGARQASLEGEYPCTLDRMSYPLANRTGGGVCDSLVVSSPSILYQSGLPWGPPQTDTLEVGFSIPIGTIRVSGTGAIKCSDATHGTVLAYDANDSLLATAAMTLIEPEDCSPAHNPDDITYGAEVVLSVGLGVRRLVIVPPSPITWETQWGTAYATAYYTVEFWDTEPPSDENVVITYPAGTPTDANGAPIVLPNQLTSRWSGSVPLNGVQAWPTSRTLRVAVVSGGVEQPGRAVTLSIASIDSGGASADSAFGHLHRADTLPKPAGTLSATTVNTGTARHVNVTFTPSIVAGPVVLTATSDGAVVFVDTLIVGVPGLIEYTQTTHDSLIGAVPGVHESNHWVRTDMRQKLRQLADSAYQKFTIKLHYNDASLRWGGRFDLNRNWTGSHSWHGLGLDIDLRTDNVVGGLSATQREFVQETWELLGGIVNDERNKPDVLPHYHLYIRGR